MKKQNRKNNKTPYLVVTLACALLVLGLGGNTLAKYVTSKTTESQVATVAKWGHVITVNAENLFGTDYTHLMVYTEFCYQKSITTTYQQLFAFLSFDAKHTQ